VDRNRVVLVGKLIERGELRLTPAGVPALNFRITHLSDQTEAGKPRRVNLELDGVALGDVAEKLGRANAEAEFRFEGFLAQKSRLSRQTVLHVNKFDSI
jgi:primosomal replication protein N